MKRILYISTGIPSPSMTFVDREICALVEAGYEISTVSKASPVKDFFSPEELAFYRETVYLDTVSRLTMFLSQLEALARRPKQYLKMLGLIMKEKEVSCPRDRFRLLFHFIEAGYLFTRLKGAGIQHIHAHMLDAPTSMALFLSRYLDVPYTFTLHGSNIYLDPLALGTKLSLAKSVVSVSLYNKSHVLAKYGKAAADKIKVVHCGLDPVRFTPRPRLQEAVPMVLSVGRLIEIKGFEFLLEACRILRNEGIVFRCHIVGDGERRETLLDLSRRLGLDGTVLFLGRQPQERVLELLQEAAVFVLPSIVTAKGGREGIPIAIMEAMAMELPVVSTRTSGIPELVEDRKEGVLVKHSDAGELAAALGTLLADPAARQAMGRAGRSKIIREFNIANVPDQLYSIFN